MTANEDDRLRTAHRAVHRTVSEATDSLLSGRSPETVILVEGVSDRRAVETLALRRGRDLLAEGVIILAMRGATNIGHYLECLGPRGQDVRLAGMYDAAEERYVVRGLERAGFGNGLEHGDLEALGFFVCVADLEDELIRAMGTDRVESVLAEQGELEPFRTFQNQPAQRGRDLDRQLRRFMGTRSGRKIRYGRLLVEALDPERVPRSLDRVLAHV